MAVRIRLTKGKDSKPEQDVVFDQETISIGREAGNTLQISGTLVSKRHAKIEGREQAYRLVDLRSTNSTFLNDQKLVADKPYDLHIGDRVRVGEYVLDIVGFGREAARKEFVEQKVPPQVSSVHVEAQLARVAEDFAGPMYVQKRAQLKQALAELIGRLESSDVEALSSGLRKSEGECERLKEENRRLQESLRTLAQQAPQPSPQPVVRVEAAPPGTASTQRLTGTMRMFLNAFARLVRGRSSFRNEFLGATMISGGEISPLVSGSADAGVQYLLEGSGSNEEWAARNTALQRELDEFVFHVVGLLDGYRTSVDGGVRMLLQKMDPEAFRNQLAQSKLKLGPIEIPYRVIPLFVEWKVMQLSIRMYQELLREDRGVLEKRFFRPAFIQGYEKCIASLRGSLGVQRDPAE